MKVLDFPLAKITIAFLFGIISSYYLTIPFWKIIGMLCFSIILFSISYYWNFRYHKKYIPFGIATYLLSFFIGVFTLISHNESLQKTNYTHCQSAFEKEQTVILILREKLKSNDYSDRFIGHVQSISGKNFSGKIIVNIQKDSSKNHLIIGNSIKIETVLQRNKSSKNPNQFDYGKYLANKQIYAQIYCQKKRPIR